jgi:hypothetical protein
MDAALSPDFQEDQQEIEMADLAKHWTKVLSGMPKQVAIPLMALILGVTMTACSPQANATEIGAGNLPQPVEEPLGEVAVDTGGTWMVPVENDQQTLFGLLEQFAEKENLAKDTAAVYRGVGIVLDGKMSGQESAYYCDGRSVQLAELIQAPGFDDLKQNTVIMIGAEKKIEDLFKSKMVEDKAQLDKRSLTIISSSDVTDNDGSFVEYWHIKKNYEDGSVEKKIFRHRSGIDNIRNAEMQIFDVNNQAWAPFTMGME